MGNIKGHPNFGTGHISSGANVGGNDGGNNLEARVAKLESDVEHIKGYVAEIRADMKDVKSDVVDLKLSIASQTTKLMLTAFSMTGLIIAAIKYL